MPKIFRQIIGTLYACDGDDDVGASPLKDKKRWYNITTNAVDIWRR